MCKLISFLFILFSTQISKYNSTIGIVNGFIVLIISCFERILEPTPEFDYKTACEVNTRIYVRNKNRKWKAVPKREFWKEQCRLLWNLWVNFVNYARPRIQNWDDPYEVDEKCWSNHLMSKIDARRKDGQFRYNPLLSVKSRRKLREIYEKYVFNRTLYDEEKGRPGRPKKITKPPTQSVVDQSASETKNPKPTSQMLRV